MSQHDFEIANQGFPSFRSDLNSGLQALASNSAGATEPSTTYAYQFWYDSTANELKMRNADDDAWITLAYFDQTNDEWEVRSAVIQAVDSAGVVIKTDDGTTRIEVQDDGDVSIDSGTLFVDATNNRAGVGTTSPATRLHTDVTGGDNELRIATTTSGEPKLTLYANGAGAHEIAFDRGDLALTFTTVGSSERMRIDSSGNLGIGTSSPNANFEVKGTGDGQIRVTSNTNQITQIISGSTEASIRAVAAVPLTFRTSNTERMRIDSSGILLVGKTASSLTTAGFQANSSSGQTDVTVSGSECMNISRLTNDGTLIRFFQDAGFEGSISVSGSTVSYNGGHLARWSRLADDSKDTSIVKGTVMTNLDAMVEWSHDAVEAQDAVYDEEGNVVSEAVEAKEAYTEDNEQLNKMAVSSVEGDPNVAGVFVNWDEDDDWNDMNIAMTGDMVIRIAQGTTVQRGDLLMSAGDGTAKPQGDDIVRSKTIAKVTSTHISHTYDDGSYLVPCVLMAC